MFDLHRPTIIFLVLVFTSCQGSNFGEAPRAFMPSREARPVKNPCVKIRSLVLEGEPTGITLMPAPAHSLAALEDSITYTQLAVAAHITGRVAAQFTVTERGTTDSVKVVRGIGAGLDQEVVETLRAFEFVPGEREGKAAAIPMRLDVLFEDGGCH